jgi:hypothetical protein
MTPQEVHAYFGSMYRFHKDTGMSLSNMSYWFKKGYVPIESQAFLHRFTKGKLKIDLDLTIVEDAPNEGK